MEKDYSVAVPSLCFAVSHNVLYDQTEGGIYSAPPGLSLPSDSKSLAAEGKRHAIIASLQGLSFCVKAIDVAFCCPLDEDRPLPAPSPARDAPKALSCSLDKQGKACYPPLSAFLGQEDHSECLV
jgi:hypothetical protein